MEFQITEFKQKLESEISKMVSKEVTLTRDNIVKLVILRKTILFA